MIASGELRSRASQHARSGRLDRPRWPIYVGRRPSRRRGWALVKLRHVKIAPSWTTARPAVRKGALPHSRTGRTLSHPATALETSPLGRVQQRWAVLLLVSGGTVIGADRALLRAASREAGHARYRDESYPLASGTSGLPAYAIARLSPRAVTAPAEPLRGRSLTSRQS